MLKTKIKELPEIEWIKPRAFLPSHFSSTKLIVELPNGQFAFLLPPLYEAEKIIPDYIYQSALAKNEYQIILKEEKISNITELFDYLKLLDNSKLR